MIKDANKRYNLLKELLNHPEFSVLSRVISPKTIDLSPNSPISAI